jgi:hypothetical protein
MTKKKSHLNAQEEQLIQRLREHPELMERFQSILELSANTEGPIKSADEVEALLIEERRRLGNTTLRDWAASAEKRLGDQLEQKDASAGVRKKNTEVVVRVRAGGGERADLAHHRQDVCSLAARGNRRQAARPVHSVAAGVDGFWH